MHSILARTQRLNSLFALLVCWLGLLAMNCPCRAYAQAAATPAVRLPPAGIAIEESERAALSAGALALREQIDSLPNRLTNKPALLALLPDVEIFHKAVSWALRYDEFFDQKQVAFAKTLLAQGVERAKQLGDGQVPWLQATGLVVRGYRSKLDDSVQPYGLVVPAGWKPGDRVLRRLDVWLAGRNEKRTELAFLSERETSPGPFAAPAAIVLHPYGRFCNANKFAGETDVFEAMDDVQAHYSIDPNRLVVGGFSMGGASTWHLATHHAGFWCLASPGAGFAETALFTKAFAPGNEAPPWWEQKLWAWYDATGYAGNLFHCPTIAYNGDIDGQKQAADVMEQAMAREGLKLERYIGPQTGHSYHPQTRERIAARMDELAAKGREPLPKEIRLTTFTLRYPRMAWVQIEGLAKHWERADVHARLEKPDVVKITTTNVTALRLFLDELRTVTIDNRKVSIPKSGGPMVFLKQSGRWSMGEAGGLRKRPGLTGPIDDAFMGPFLFVRPTGKPLNEAVGRWTEEELARATNMWRNVFRAELTVKDDVKVTSDDASSKNLVLWGDPKSNRLITTILDQLPIEWSGEKLAFNGQDYDPAKHAAIMIFPNPLNRGRYVVLNSGIDFRNDAYGSNAKQTPKLPDWAIIDVTVPAGPRWPGGIASAGFFDEQWRPTFP